MARSRSQSDTEHDFIPVVDLFAGPGGLGEGFSSVLREDGLPAFKIVLSVEMDPHAHRTLELRSFRRQFTSRGDRVPKAYYDYLRTADPKAESAGRERLFKQFKAEGDAARQEALHATLGTPEGDELVHKRLAPLLKTYADRDWVVLGGPPCQAYSLVGRARNKGIADYDETNDKKHKLYEQYLEIIRAVRPAIFVMENVKGILSSKYQKARIFDQIKQDLRDPKVKLAGGGHLRYELVSATSDRRGDDLEDTDFVVRAEEHGIPQARHRVFVIGMRDRGLPWQALGRRFGDRQMTVKDAIEDLPRLRSGLSKEPDDKTAWREAIRFIGKEAWLKNLDDPTVIGKVEQVCTKASSPKDDRGSHFVENRKAMDSRLKDAAPKNWFDDERLGGALNHETRSHIRADLSRYLFCAAWAMVKGRNKRERISPKLHDMPKTLLPKHANAGAAASSGSLFNDRFRAQSWNAPSTTITAHISKDGHYFIHPDPTQVRSLTVREAARLQTFPDDYLFCGPRTEQYRQVGNAVPPLLALQIAEIVSNHLGS